MKGDKEFNRVGKAFSVTIKICTAFGLIIMIISGILYFIGINQSVDLIYTIKNWDKTSVNFWKGLSSAGKNYHTWFLSSIGKTDSLTIMGIIILTISPLAALLSILTKLKRIYMYMVILLIIELLFSIIKTFI